MAVKESSIKKKRDVYKRQHLSWGIVYGGVKREKRIMGEKKEGDF